MKTTLPPGLAASVAVCLKDRPWKGAPGRGHWQSWGGRQGGSGNRWAGSALQPAQDLLNSQTHQSLATFIAPHRPSLLISGHFLAGRLLMTSACISHTHPPSPPGLLCRWPSQLSCPGSCRGSSDRLGPTTGVARVVGKSLGLSFHAH